MKLTIDGEQVHEMLSVVVWAMQGPPGWAVALFESGTEWRRYHRECVHRSVAAIEFISDMTRRPVSAEFRRVEALRDAVCDACMRRVDNSPDHAFADNRNK